MKKIHLIESIQGFLASDNASDSKAMYHPEEIKTALNNVFNQLIYNAWLNGKKFSDFSQLDAWSRTYITIVVGQVGARAYAQLPFAPVSLPDGGGVQAVYDHADSGNMFAPIESDAGVIFAELEVDDMDSTPTYVLEQLPDSLRTSEGELSHRLLLDKLPVAPNTLITSLDVMMIIPMEVMGDYDEIVLPTGAEDTIIRQVLDLMSKKPTPDVNNDMVIQK
jgi:hypothetical protein